MDFKLPYGHGHLHVEIPEKNLKQVLRPNEAPEIADLSGDIERALKAPSGSPPLQEVAGKADTVAIVVDDITRPTPTRLMLPPIISELHAAGVSDEAITIVFATGLHRPHTQAEREHLLGENIVERYRVIDHTARDESSLVYLGDTSRGTPVSVNRVVAEADLRVLTGLIKPHGFAGYTGGGKAILPGVSGMRTIISDHGYEALDNPCSVLGVITGNPMREDVEEAAGMIGTTFILNLVVDWRKKAIGVAAGDMIEAHREGASILDSMAKVPAHGKVDVVIAGSGHPIDINLYQMLNSLIACTRLPVPLIRRGGIVIIAGEAPEGIGHQDFLDIMRSGSSPEEILDIIAQPGFFKVDQWAAQVLCEILKQIDVIVVSENLSPESLDQLYLEHAPTVESALARAFDRLGSDLELAMVPMAPYTIPVVHENDEQER
jgi:nickel-dependent lactate racemase